MAFRMVEAPLEVDSSDISELSYHVEELVTAGELLRATEVTRRGTELSLSIHDRIEEDVELPSRMETSYHRNGDSYGVFTQAWKNGLIRGYYAIKENKASTLQRCVRCVEYADQNEEKLRDLINVDAVKTLAKHYLGTVLYELGDYRNAIPNFLASENYEGFDQDLQCYTLGLSFLDFARFQTTDAEEKRRSVEKAVSYFRRSFSLFAANCEISARSKAFRAADDAIAALYFIKDFGQAAEVSKEAALLTKELKNPEHESKFWWVCGCMLYLEQRYSEALTSCVASLEAALQTEDESLIEQAFTWVNMVLLYAAGKKKEEVDRIVSEPVDNTEASLSRVSKVQRRVEANLVLGLAKFNTGLQNQAIELLEKALAMSNDAPCQDAVSNRVMCRIVYFLAVMHDECGNGKVAAPLFQRCETLYEDLDSKIKCAFLRGWTLARHVDLEQSLAVLFEALDRYENLQNSLPNAVAELFCALGLGLVRCGRLEDAILKLNEACRIWDESKGVDQSEVPFAYMGLYEAYIMRQEYWQAFELAKRFQPVLDQYHKEAEIMWLTVQGTGHLLLANFNQGAQKYLTKALEDAEKNDDWKMQVTILGNLARTYRGQKNLDGALRKYDELEMLLQGHEGNDFSRRLRAEMFIDQADVFNQKGIAAKSKEVAAKPKGNAARRRRAAVKQRGNIENEEEWYGKALESYKKATDILVHLPFSDSLQARAYAGQAGVLLNLGISGAEADDATEKAMKMAGDDQLLIAKIHYIQAERFRREHEYDKALEAARRAALQFADVQIGLRNLESAWVSFFGNDMKHTFIILQLVYNSRKEYTKALLWAERGRMRLFQFKVGSNQHLEGTYENCRGASSSACQRLGTRPVDEHTTDQSGVDDLHHLELVEMTGKNPECSGYSENFLIMNDKNSRDSVRESRHVTCKSERDVGNPKVEVSEINDRLQTCLIDNIDNEHKSQGDSTSRLKEETPCELSNTGVRTQDPLWFDKDDHLAENLIFETLEMCGKGTAIIEYMYADLEQTLLIYVVIGGAKRLVHCQRVDLANFFKTEDTLEVTSLRMLVAKTLTKIMSLKEQDDEIPYLQVLFTLLIAPVSERIANCSKVIFVPHEVLYRVPFHALHDGKEFLVQGKYGGVIPSIRSLHYCFSKQQAYEDARKNGTLGSPFVAGDPYPMGLGMGGLKGAAEEVAEVAQLLGVTATTREHVTKEAVVEGLSSGCVSVLVTHGIVDRSYPHGALVLKGVDQPTILSQIGDVLEPLALSRSSRAAGLLGEMNVEKAVANASEVITADEIIALPGGIPAGLVVLSACETGYGEVTSEGLLGLGRAVLQAGASAVVVSHWEVDDYSTKALMKGFIEVLTKEGKPAAEALQTAMLNMLNEGSYKPYHWAPFVVLGSPFMKYFESKTTSSTSMQVKC